ncbi:MAG: metal-dependent transcriptional regulator [Candidatus Micrarchaeota archaeon]|nr:metal-dependent transcriptional regulator [Candidatus Micrarchaeota archaeon]
MKHGRGRSQNLEEYLEEMYRLEKDKENITTKGLAKSLRIKMPSVSEMLSKMGNMKLIEYEARGEIRLTKKGRMIGKRVYGKFIRIRGLLMDIGMKGKDAEREACILEHAISEKLMKLIERRIAKE